ncbi:MAG: type II toxin-antitoxin system prevent-host-death family antitoxin [Proteobacteria bacterium]|nr:type II toxin-antitoxin system prevent-host-death family antitoxin [Pseudomonadota bacterium]
MLRVKIDELKTGLSRLLRRVKAGESVVVYDGDTPIARIEPMAAAERPTPKTDDERLASLVARGIALAPKNPNPDWSFLNEPLPKADSSVLEALLEERRDGR